MNKEATAAAAAATTITITITATNNNNNNNNNIRHKLTNAGQNHNLLLTNKSFQNVEKFTFGNDSHKSQSHSRRD